MIISKIADVGKPKTPTPLASANIGTWGHPSPPKTCRRLKWMVPKAFCLEIFFVLNRFQIFNMRHKAKPAAYLTRIPIEKVENPPINCAFNLLFFNF